MARRGAGRPKKKSRVRRRTKASVRRSPAVREEAEVVYWEPPTEEQKAKQAYLPPLHPSKAKRRRVLKIDGAPVVYWEPVTRISTPLPTTVEEQAALRTMYEYNPPEYLAPDIQALLRGLRVDAGQDHEVRAVVADRLPKEGTAVHRWPVPCPDSLCRGHRGQKLRAYAAVGGGTSAEDHAPWCAIWDLTGSAPF